MLIKQSNDPPGADTMYREKDRPQFHFTSRRGWLNDPNGLVWYQGKYHLFYQHNPYGWEWGNMHWGHAVAPTCFTGSSGIRRSHRVKFGDWAFSGSAVVDHENRSGFARQSFLGLGGKPDGPVVAAFTSTGPRRVHRIHPSQRASRDLWILWFLRTTPS